ncbi:response regulator transcription factor [Flavobacterium sp. SUN046]|uniref:response regulator transcription factor n=1 Tax=Flavobacterium sp. SUN046 TaxID=3002440 RepID=UPI002DBAB392|nr:response regulator transcription factor [Flavobacterium sp. SUN046]MEC4049623.1 response regulator transcription factor [Flavobacterium sp. SUN046]
MKSGKNILLVDDHMVVRKGIELIIANQIDKCTIYNAENYDEALEVLKCSPLDLILLDININGVENIKIMKEMKSIQPHIKILVFSSHDEKQYGLRYIDQGADGYLNKFCSEDKIMEAVNEILSKGNFYSVAIKEKLLAKANKKNYSNPIDSLSNREYEIATMLINGFGNLEIANKLDLQMSTVSTYKNRVFEKLNITNVVALSDLFKNSNL